MPDGDPLSFAVWRGQHTTAEDLDRAIHVLTDQLETQLGWPVRVEEKREVTLSGAPFDTYNDYLDAFGDVASLEAGTINICLYDWSVLGHALQPILGKIGIGEYDATGDEALPFAGYYKGQLAPDSKPRAVVNTSMKLRPLPKSLFENFLIHEALHPVLDDAHAPDSGEDHSFGSTHLGTASPLLTGYSEIVTLNPRPASECDGKPVGRTVRHTLQLSDCTTAEVVRYMEDEFQG